MDRSSESRVGNSSVSSDIVAKGLKEGNNQPATTTAATKATSFGGNKVAINQGSDENNSNSKRWLPK